MFIGDKIFKSCWSTFPVYAGIRYENKTIMSFYPWLFTILPNPRCVGRIVNNGTIFQYFNLCTENPWFFDFSFIYPVLRATCSSLCPSCVLIVVCGPSKRTFRFLRGAFSIFCFSCFVKEVFSSLTSQYSF